MFFYILKVCFIAKADNSTFHVLEFKKHWFNLCNLIRWQCRCLTNVVVVVIIDCMVVITRNTQSFSLTIVTRCFCKAPWKRFSFYFPFSLWRRYHRFIKFIEIIHPRSLCQLWWNYSQLARLFKVKAFQIALSPDLNTARWFARMDLSASVQKQQGCLMTSAVM